MTRWSAAETSISIDYSQELMEAIRGEAGGALFGIRENKHVTLLAFRAGAIDEALARSHETDPELKGMIPVGWFVPHARAATVSMTAAEEAIFQKFFPGRWQVTLVAGAARGGFFIYEPGGSVRREKSYREFELKPLAYARGSDKAQKFGTWGWAAALSFVLGAGAAAAFFLFFWKPAVPPLGLTVGEVEKQLLICWNPAAIANADSATIEVKEPESSRLLNLKRQQLARGAYPLEYTSGDLNLRMTSYGRDGSILLQEGTHYLGHPVAASRDLLEAERLRAENVKLQADLKNQTARVRQLEQRVKALTQPPAGP